MRGTAVDEELRGLNAGTRSSSAGDASKFGNSAASTATGAGVAGGLGMVLAVIAVGLSAYTFQNLEQTWNHVATQNVTMSNFTITLLADPVDEQDAVNLRYFEANAGSGGDPADSLGNHTATQDLDLGNFRIINLGEPADNEHAATKGYVDTRSLNQFDGSSVGSAVDFNNNQLQGVAAPTLSTDGANKAYVDASVPNQGVDTGDTPTFNGLSANNQRIVFVADPTSAQDAATKAYVDTEVAGAGDDLGDHTATQALNMGGFVINNAATPTLDGDAATKGYVDGNLPNQGVDTGDTPTFNGLSAGSARITSVADPTSAQDAATKAYVDSEISGVGGGDNLGDHTATEALDMGNFRINNLGTPSLSTDAATKAYVDASTTFDTDEIEIIDHTGSSGRLSFDLSGSAPFSTFSLTISNDVNLDTVVNTGDTPTFSGLNAGSARITNVANPTSAQDAATKTYVDTNLPNQGVDTTDTPTFTGLSAGNQRITAVASPSSLTDAANKQYTDAAAAAPVIDSTWAIQDDGLGAAIVFVADATTVDRTITMPDNNVDLGNVPNQGVSTTDTPTFAGVDVSGNKITSVDTPTIGTDAVTKDYADNPVSTTWTLTSPSGVDRTVVFDLSALASDSTERTITMPDANVDLGALGGGTTFADNVFRVQDDGDATKQIAFQASGITTSNTRTIHMPDVDVTLPNQGTSTTDTPTFSGLSANSQRITSVADPTSAQDAATKAYVDAAGGGGGGTTELVACTTDFMAGWTSDACIVAGDAGGTFTHVDDWDACTTATTSVTGSSTGFTFSADGHATFSMLAEFVTVQSGISGFELFIGIDETNVGSLLDAGHANKAGFPDSSIVPYDGSTPWEMRMTVTLPVSNGDEFRLLYSCDGTAGTETVSAAGIGMSVLFHPT